MIFSKFLGAACRLTRDTGRIIGVRYLRTTPKLQINDGNYKWKQQFQRLIGNREQVGFGMNGQPTYHDSAVFPFPAIRYKEPTAEIKALREKEKGDWKELSIDEKKALYRASFCQTFSEFQAITGEWKTIVGCALMLVALGLWLNIIMYTCVYSQTPVPPSFSEESVAAQVRRQLDLHTNPITGIAGDWDYNKCDWKKPYSYGQLPNPYIDPCTGERVCNDYSE